MLAGKVCDKCNVLRNCFGFIVGTVIEIARQIGSRCQWIAYNGQNRKQALMF